MTDSRSLTNQQVKKLLKRIEEMKKSGDLDLSLEEDLSIAIMNLVSLEEHFFFTGAKTGKDEYYSLLTQIREIRKELLGRMISTQEGEAWCISKHLLAASMRLIEVGTKLQGEKKPEEAGRMFGLAWQLYTLFWSIRLKGAKLNGVKKVADDQLNIHDDSKTAGWTVEDIVKKLVDCCKE